MIVSIPNGIVGNTLWKSKNLQQEECDLNNNKKLEHQNNCGATVIIPRVLPFLITRTKVFPKEEDQRKILYIIRRHTVRGQFFL